MKRSCACFVNSLRGYGGAEVWMLDAARGLAERGRPVCLVAQPGSALLARARAAGLPAESVPIRCDGAPWTLAQLARALRRHRAGAVVCNLTKDLKAAGVAARLCGVPVVLASRESDFPLKSRRHYRWYFGRVASGVLVNSQATRATVLASAPWLRPERVHLLYKGIDTARFQPRQAAGGPGARGPAVGFAGQLIERKGLHALMAAWSLLAARAEGAPRLLVAGEGPLAGELERWRACLPRPERVERRGFVEDMAGFYTELDLLVLPSRAEGFGLVAAEALACGVPVVATAVSSLPEIVADGETGVLVPVDDPPRLAAAVSSLLADPDRARRLGAAGRARVAARFSRERSLDRLEALLDGAAGGEA